jgi:class 3 adenylate cyclase
MGISTACNCASACGVHVPAALSLAIDTPLGEPEDAGEFESVESLSREAEVRTFLIADIRGYTRFTEERGDEVAARLAARFASVTRETVGTRGGAIVEVRGDEALAVFASARQALRAAVELQVRFEDESRADPDLPLNVGIGVDSGEAVRIDGGFRGAALNVAARLCGLAHAGEVIVTDSVVHLAGRLEGIRYVDRGRVHLKGISEPVHILELRRELSPVHGASWSWRPLDWSKALGWRLVLGVAVIAAATAGVVVLLTTRGPSGGAATSDNGARQMPTGGMAMGSTEGKKLSPSQRLNSYLEDRPWSCHNAMSSAPGALASILCSTDVPNRLQLTLFRSQKDLERAYRKQLEQASVPRSSGNCRADSWRGEVEWFHGLGEPGGRAFCYLSVASQRSYLTWTSDAGAKILAVAQLDSLLHRNLFFWWANVRHEIV